MREIYSTKYSSTKKKIPVNDLSFYLREPEKEKEITPKAGRRKEIIKNKAKITEIQNRKVMEKINEN